MRKSEELLSDESCFGRAKDQEMIFVLLGRDIASPATIRFWAEERIALGKNARKDPQIIEALQCAETMERERRAALPVEGIQYVDKYGVTLFVTKKNFGNIFWATQQALGGRYDLGLKLNKDVTFSIEKHDVAAFRDWLLRKMENLMGPNYDPYEYDNGDANK